eukprot:7870292-Pyramimonas_sp.AAC.2
MGVSPRRSRSCSRALSWWTFIAGANISGSFYTLNPCRVCRLCEVLTREESDLNTPLIMSYDGHIL